MRGAQSNSYLTGFRIASRVSAALFATYAATWVLAYAAALVLPMRQTEAVIVTSLAAILVYLCLMLWAFVADLRTVWLTLATLTAAGTAAAYLFARLQ